MSRSPDDDARRDGDDTRRVDDPVGSQSATSTDGGRTASEPTRDPRLVEQLDHIHRIRRRRTIAGASLVAVIGFVFVQGLSATGFLDEEFQWEFFNESLRNYFPMRELPPFLDVGVYVSYIRSENLLYDPEIGGLLFRWPPQLYTFFFEELGIFAIFGEAGITLAMGVVGTILGFPLALLFGVLGSERVTPFPFNFLFRGTMSFIRSIPALVWTLIFIPLAGLGPAAATLAIAVDTIGNLGRLFVDELEEIADGPIEAMETTGASGSQTVVFGMLTQVRSSFIAWTLYILEINVRIAVTVGVYGAGGLGQVVEVQQGLLRWANVMATLLCIFLLIITVELFSQRLRARLRADEVMGWRELIFGFPRRMAESVTK